MLEEEDPTLMKSTLDDITMRVELVFVIGRPHINEIDVNV
jgi:hypothetical protein